jgi:hypothetical protein
LPYLEHPAERPKLKVLITPDSSGSTQGWSGLARAWATIVARDPEVDVIYLDNFNGSFDSSISTQVEDSDYQWGRQDWASDEVRELMESLDVVIYLGDSDGSDLCAQYASYGVTVVALDSYCANVAEPRLRKTVNGSGQILWFDRCSAHATYTWYRALEMALDTF